MGYMSIKFASRFPEFLCVKSIGRGWEGSKSPLSISEAQRSVLDYVGFRLKSM